MSIDLSGGALATVPTNRWRTNRWAQLDTHATLHFHRHQGDKSWNREDFRGHDDDHQLIFQRRRKLELERVLVCKFVTLRETSSPDWPPLSTPDSHFSHHNLVLELGPIREDINRKKTFSFGHCPKHLNPPPPWPQFGQLGPFFRTLNFKIWKSLEGGVRDIITT